MAKRWHPNGGFTLIELLIVLVIIGTLAVVSIVNYASAQSKARDAKRASDIIGVGGALKLYFTDNKRYPNSIGNYWSTGTAGMCDWRVDANWAVGLAPNYLAILPVDPEPDTSCSFQRGYAYRSDGSGFWMMAHQPENCQAVADQGLIDPARNCWAWAVYSSPDYFLGQ